MCYKKVDRKFSDLHVCVLPYPLHVQVHISLVYEKSESSYWIRQRKKTVKNIIKSFVLIFNIEL